MRGLATANWKKRSKGKTPRRSPPRRERPTRASLQTAAHSLAVPKNGRQCQATNSQIHCYLRDHLRRHLLHQHHLGMGQTQVSAGGNRVPHQQLRSRPLPTNRSVPATRTRRPSARFDPTSLHATPTAPAPGRHPGPGNYTPTLAGSRLQHATRPNPGAHPRQRSAPWDQKSKASSGRGRLSYQRPHASTPPSISFR